MYIISTQKKKKTLHQHMEMWYQDESVRILPNRMQVLEHRRIQKTAHQWTVIGTTS